MSATLALSGLIWWTVALVLALSTPRMVRRNEATWAYRNRQARRYSWAWGWFCIGVALMLAAVWMGAIR